ncbi:MAG: hypothetical protein EHM93_19135 [Bacteroidales bacterium]|nr:MAG: hypothetical protein EHM93_19135 [Bacteroidales bacterium]
MNIEQTLDNKALELLADLRNHYEISFQQKNINYCETYTQNGKSIIYYNPKIVDNESIVHELLHIWLDKYNYIIGNHIFLSCKSHNKLNKVFRKFLCDYIGNCLDHNKMYSKYLEMGYGPEKFLMDALDEKCSIREIKRLHLKFLGRYKAKSIDRFIGYLISIYADHVHNDYSEHLKLLKSKDPDLFKIVTDFWNKWTKFDIETIDPIYNSDIELAESFILEMEQWIDNK